MTEYPYTFNDNLVKYKQPYKLTDKSPVTGVKKPDKCGSKDEKKVVKEIKTPKIIEEAEEILNAIIPPINYEFAGMSYIQEISSCPATKPDVIKLQIELDKRLEGRGAKKTGICPIRRQLYNQCFDEIIRQITIDCAERGLILLRVRNEISITIRAYQHIYESGIMYAIQKTMKNREKEEVINRSIVDLNAEIESLNGQVKEGLEKCEATTEKEQGKLDLIIKKANEEINFLSKTHDGLVQQLKDVLSSLR